MTVRLLLLAIALAAAACDLVWPYSGNRVPAPDRTSPFDAPVPRADGDGQLRDASRDLRSLGPLSCDAPTVVGGESVSLGEPALHPAGRQLVAQDESSCDTYRAVRFSTATSFEAFARVVDKSLPGNQNDPTFLSWNSSTYLLSAGATKPRKIFICKLPAEICNSPITVQVDGQPVDWDMDGPSVITLGDGPLMVFNMLPNGSVHAAVYSARPEDTAGDPTLWIWAARLLGEISSPSDKQDDPGLSPDGTAIVFERNGDLHSATRPSVESDFGPATPLAGVNSAALDASPTLHDWGDGRLELFFQSRRADAERSLIYRSVCKR